MAFPPIPEVPKDSPRGLFRILGALKEALDIGLGRKGNSRDKFVTEGRLQDAGLVQSTTQTGSRTGGLGNAASKNVGTGAGTVAAGDHTHAGVYDPAGTAANAVAEHVNSGGHPWSAITETDDAITVPDYIGDDFTIAYRRQLVVSTRVAVDAALNIVGTLRVI